MPVYRGDPAVRRERVTSIADGGICNLSRLELGVHSGTHIDAPVHFIEGAAGVEATPLHALLGDAFVVDATALDSDIDAAALRNLDMPAGCPRLLFKTANSRLWRLDEFSNDFIGLTEDAARLLVERGARLVGIDYLSIAPFGDPAPTHLALLGAGAVILEGLNLAAVSPGPCELICLPLLLQGSDGAPARTLLGRPE